MYNELQKNRIKKQTKTSTLKNYEHQKTNDLLQMFCWGSNSHGQLGLGRHISSTANPQIVTSLGRLNIIDVAAGQYHSMALTASGQVYVWGWGLHGQLGCSSYDNEHYPRLLPFEAPVCEIAAGYAHSLVLTCSGKLFGFGSNAFGQLERSKVGLKTSRPVRLMVTGNESVGVEKIATGYFQSVSINNDALFNVFYKKKCLKVLK